MSLDGQVSQVIHILERFGVRGGDRGHLGDKWLCRRRIHPAQGRRRERGPTGAFPHPLFIPSGARNLAFLTGTSFVLPFPGVVEITPIIELNGVRVVAAMATTRAKIAQRLDDILGSGSVNEIGAHYGVTGATISRWRSGSRLPDALTITKIRAQGTTSTRYHPFFGERLLGAATERWERGSRRVRGVCGLRRH